MRSERREEETGHPDDRQEGGKTGEDAGGRNDEESEDSEDEVGRLVNGLPWLYGRGVLQRTTRL